jgi:FkbM family methyltransferase
MKPLDQIYQQEKFENPTLMKIDVQGYEPQLLKGARNFLKICNPVQLEVHF